MQFSSLFTASYEEKRAVEKIDMKDRVLLMFNAKSIDLTLEVVQLNGSVIFIKPKEECIVSRTDSLRVFITDDRTANCIPIHDLFCIDKQFLSLKGCGISELVISHDKLYPTLHIRHSLCFRLSIINQSSKAITIATTKNNNVKIKVILSDSFGIYFLLCVYTHLGNHIDFSKKTNSNNVILDGLKFTRDGCKLTVSDVCK